MCLPNCDCIAIYTRIIFVEYAKDHFQTALVLVQRVGDRCRSSVSGFLYGIMLCVAYCIYSIQLMDNRTYNQIRFKHVQRFDVVDLGQWTIRFGWRQFLPQ